MRVGHINESFVLIAIIVICITAITIVTLFAFKNSSQDSTQSKKEKTKHFCPVCGNRLVVGKYEPRVAFGRAKPFYALICNECGYISPVGSHHRLEAEAEYAAYIQGRIDYEYITDHDTTLQIEEYGLEEHMVNAKAVIEAGDSAKSRVMDSKVAKGIMNRARQFKTSHRARKRFKEMRNSCYSARTRSEDSPDDRYFGGEEK